MSIKIHSLTLGIAATNAYILGDTESKEAIVIDPVDKAELLLQTATEAGWQIKLILATHGHYDHILASHDLKQMTGAGFYMHRNAPQMRNDVPDHPMIRQIFPAVPAAEHLIGDETETISLGSILLETLYTPGHAPGHVCFYLRSENILFGGDCLFAGSIGRTDLPFGDYKVLMDSIFNQMLPLGDEVRLLPGHMQGTTLGRERQTNPFLLAEAAQRTSI